MAHFISKACKRTCIFMLKPAWGPRNSVLGLAQIERKIRGSPSPHFTAFFFFFPDPRDFAECATEKACSSPTPHLINWKLTFSLTHRWGRPARIFQRVYTHMGSHWPWLRMKFQLIDAGRIDRIYLKWNFHFRSWLPKHVFFLMSTRSPRLGCDVLSHLRSPIQAAIDFAASRGSNLLANNTPNLCVLTCNKKTPDESMSILRPLPLLILSHVQA